MAQVDDSEIAELDRITIAAVVRAAGRGLLSTAEAGTLINRIHAQTTTPPAQTESLSPRKS